MTSGTVLRIEKSSIYDGDGLRTVVFLKGCNLRCLWCSTPESQQMEPELDYGRHMSADEVLAEVMKDEVFYFHSGGGLTVSGGEPLLQADFVAELLRGCRRHGVSTALETSFGVPWPHIEKVLPHLDTLFVDIKHMDSAEHRRLTGGGNELILENLNKADAAPQRFDIIVRTPLIPGLNDGEENIRRIAALAAAMRKLSALQFLPYHRLGSSTYAKMGREYALKDVPLPPPDYVAKKYALIREDYPDLALI